MSQHSCMGFPSVRELYRIGQNILENYSRQADLEKVPDPGILDPRKNSGLRDLAEKIWANSSALLRESHYFCKTDTSR